MRWYDANPVVSDAVKAWECFPPNLQRELAKYVYKLIVKDQFKLRYTGLYRLVALYILPMHEAHWKRRWYDQDKVVQRTFNIMPLMHPGSLNEMAFIILKLRQYIEYHSIDAKAATDKELYRTIDYVFKNPNLI